MGATEETARGEREREGKTVRRERQTETDRDTQRETERERETETHRQQCMTSFGKTGGRGESGEREYSGRGERARRPTGTN